MTRIKGSTYGQITRQQTYGDYAVDLEEYDKAPALSSNIGNTKRFVVHRYHKGKMTHFWWYRFKWMANFRYDLERETLDTRPSSELNGHEVSHGM